MSEPVERRKDAVPENRRNPLLFELEGAFNPGWLLFITFSVLGALVSLGALVVSMRVEGAWPAAVAALSFIAFAMLCTAIIVVPIARAKLLAPALKDAAAGISKAGGNVTSLRLGGTDNVRVDDERGEP
jgi:hypothetical protein